MTPAAAYQAKNDSANRMEEALSYPLYNFMCYNKFYGFPRGQ